MRVFIDIEGKELTVGMEGDGVTLTCTLTADQARSLARALTEAADVAGVKLEVVDALAD